ADQSRVELLTAFTASRWQIFRMLRIPMALPYMFAGLQVAALNSVTGAVVGEFIGAEGGLGYLILQRTQLLDVPGMFAVLFVLAVLGITIQVLTQFARRRIVFWV